MALIALAAFVWMTLLVLVNWWEFTNLWLRRVWSILLLGAMAARMLWGQGSSRPQEPGGLLEAASLVAAVLVGVGLWLVATALVARRYRGEAIDLVFPLRGGRFLITDGGDGAKSFLVNYHYGFGRHRASGVNDSMRYAMDIVEVGQARSEAHGFLPRRNEAYRIWDKPLFAPCDGRVVHTVGDVEDNLAFGHHRPYGVGNHVVVRSGADIYVVLGHMRCGSVTVSRGDAVKAGDLIGRVGNSGWTERPHLHMQAMRSAKGDWWHGQPAPMRFEGRFLVRNQVLRA